MLSMMSSKSIVMVTEKDATKLIKPQLMELIPVNKVFIQPVKPHFLFNEEGKFNEIIKRFLK